MRRTTGRLSMATDPELADAPRGHKHGRPAAFFPSARLVKRPQSTRLPPTRREPTPARRTRADSKSAQPATTSSLSVRSCDFLDRLGFDPVDAGPLKNGVALEPDGSPIATTYSAEQLAKRIPAGANRWHAGTRRVRQVEHARTRADTRDVN